MQRLVAVTAATARLLPILGWLLLLAAAAKIALGIFGRTVVTLAASGGEVEFAKLGHDRALADFIAEVGRHLPGAGSRPA
jgi:hypothetical protein